MVLLYLLSIIGLCRIIVDSAIFEPLRVRYQSSAISYLFSCYQCAGFWSGVIIGLLILLSKYCDTICILIYAFAGSAINILFNDIIELIRSIDTLNRK